MSDPHVLSRTAAEWRSIVFNKRVTGYANLLLRRGRVHRREYLLAVALIALSSAVPRPPFVAGGYVGRQQLEALEHLLAHPAVRQRTPVVLIHHPPVDARPRLMQLRDGLVDAAALRAVLAPLPRGIVLFGHLHVRRRCTLSTPAGTIDVIGASGAALDHRDSAIRAGFNLYVVNDSGSLASVEAHVLDPVRGEFEKRSIDRTARCA